MLPIRTPTAPLPLAALLAAVLLAPASPGRAEDSAQADAKAEDAPKADAKAEDVIANTGSARIEFAAREWLDVGLDVNGVRVDRLQLHQAPKFQRFFTKNDEANRGRIWITNRTDKAVAPALALAILDKDGRLLAAANTGARTRHVEPGASMEMELKFGGVFRHMDLGDFILVSLEY